VELALCQIVGHAYDLDVMELWDYYEDVFRRLSECSDVAFMTNLDVVRYLQAMDSVVFSDWEIQNPSALDMWFEVDGHVICIGAGECVPL
jgi:hypothetical protein